MSDSDPAYPAPIIIGAVVLCIVVMAMILICKDWNGRLKKSHNKNINLEYKVTCNMQELKSVTSMEDFLSNIARQKPFRFSPDQLASFTNNFSQVLGSGGYGTVYKGVFPNGVPIAVKVLHSTSTHRASEQFMAEIGTIGRTYHINLVTLYGFCYHNTTMCALVYEYMEFGSLSDLLFTNLKWSLDYKTLHDIAIGVAKALAYLHEECTEKIVHYDIKPENVLLDVNYMPKVADFGLAILCNRDTSNVLLSSYRGTPGYAAPEMCTPYPVTHRCDIYSFGMLLFEIVGKRRNNELKHNDTTTGPFGRTCSGLEWQPQLMYEKFSIGELDDMIANTCGIVQGEEVTLAKRAILVAIWCVQYSPKSRPSMSSVVRMLRGDVGIEIPPNPFRYIQYLNSDLGDNTSISMASTSMCSTDEGSLVPSTTMYHSLSSSM